MAGFLDNILDYIRVNEDDDDEYMNDYYEDESEEVRGESLFGGSRRSEMSERKASRRSVSRDNYEPEQEVPRKERVVRTEKSSKVVPMRAATKGLEVCIVKPSSFEDSQQVCEVLLGGRACVVNLEGFDADDAQRFMDFISGCIFAIDGKLHRISKYIFIFAPSNVDISGDYLDLLPDDKKNAMTINKGF